MKEGFGVEATVAPLVGRSQMKEGLRGAEKSDSTPVLDAVEPN